MSADPARVSSFLPERLRAALEPEVRSPLERPGVPEMPTSSSHYFREAVDAAGRNGLAVDALMAAVGLTAEQLSDPRWRGDLQQLAHIVQLTSQALDDEFMGFLPERSKPGTFAMMTHCIAFEPTLGQALRKGVRFYALFNEAVEMSVVPTRAGAAWTVRLARPDLDPTHYYTEFWMSIWFRLLVWLSGDALHLDGATFAYSVDRERRRELDVLFRCPLTFDAEVTALAFSAKSLQLPMVRNRVELKEFLAGTPLGVMTPTSEETRIARRVLAMIQPRDAGALDFPTFGTIAARLFMTEQTLRRRLRDESTSYRAIKESVRRTVAEHKLRETNLSIQDLSALIGYSEPRAFTRAFQQWTGMTPVAYRAEYDGDPPDV